MQAGVFGIFNGGLGSQFVRFGAGFGAFGFANGARFLNFHPFFLTRLRFGAIGGLTLFELLQGSLFGLGGAGQSGIETAGFVVRHGVRNVSEME